MPTTWLNESSSESAWSGTTWSTRARTSDSRTWSETHGSVAPLTATPSAHATTSTATALSSDPPTASTARTGCHGIRSRIRAPPNCSRAWPNEAPMSTRNSAPSDTQTEGSAAPKIFGASQIPSSPPRSSPVVAKAPVMKPCQ